MGVDRGGGGSSVGVSCHTISLFSMMSTVMDVVGVWGVSGVLKTPFSTHLFWSDFGAMAAVVTTPQKHTCRPFFTLSTYPAYFSY